MTHTPGPWKYETRIQRGTYSQPVKGSPIRYYVTGPRPSPNFAEPIICHLGPTYERAEADARLIAVAPELLEALKKIVAWHDCFPPTSGEEDLPIISQARAAIAQAEGR